MTLECFEVMLGLLLDVCRVVKLRGALQEDLESKRQDTRGKVPKNRQRERKKKVKG